MSLSPTRSAHEEMRDKFFEDGFTQCLRTHLRRHAQRTIPITVFYAFKQVGDGR